VSLPRLVATVGGIGHLPGGPGTWASAATIPLAWVLHMAGGIWLLAAATVAVTLLGHWATARYIEGRPDADPSEVVIDEVAGMMVALWPLSLGLTMAGTAPHVFPWPGWVGAFLLFRFFDILKPPPVSWAERPAGALGIMLDDLVAGLLAALVITIAAGVAHGWF
jgi:phosphatidylglycerophosphatase A